MLHAHICGCHPWRRGTKGVSLHIGKERGLPCGGRNALMHILASPDNFKVVQYLTFKSRANARNAMWKSSSCCILTTQNTIMHQCVSTVPLTCTCADQHHILFTMSQPILNSDKSAALPVQSMVHICSVLHGHLRNKPPRLNPPMIPLPVCSKRASNPCGTQWQQAAWARSWGLVVHSHGNGK